MPSALTIFIAFLREKPEKKKMLISLKQVFVSGEALTESQRKAFINLLPDIALMNLYGPTEATIDVSYFDCTKKNKYQLPPIGKPIDNIKLYVFDKIHSHARIGVIGNLFISGVGLSKGYIQNEKLTAKKFIGNPFDSNFKMYDTGDLAKWLPDGNIDYVGRTDSQIKFRGYRIEFGEIEHALMEQPEINHAIVDLKSFKQNEVLVAYILYQKNMEIGKVNFSNRLQQLLPNYMIPSFYISLESLPIKENGKLKRASLPALKEEHTIQRIRKLPKNKVQKQLVEIWQEVLGIEKIGVNELFFELGGHSLLVTQIINRISQRLQKTITVKDFLMLATIENIEPALKNENDYKISDTSDYEETII